MKINALTHGMPSLKAPLAPAPVPARTSTSLAELERLPGQLPSDPSAARSLVCIQAAGAAQILAGPQKFDRDSSPEELLKVAQEAASLPKGDPRLAALLDQLRTAMNLPVSASDFEIKRRHDALGRAYMLVADKLRPEDLDALVDGLKEQFMFRRTNEARRNDAPFAAVLGKAAESMSPEDSARVRDALRRQLVQPDAGGAAQALGCMAAQLKREDVVALDEYLTDLRKRNQDGPHSRAADRALRQALELAQDKGARNEAAWVLVDDLRSDRLNDVQKDRLIEAAQDDHELKKVALDSLPDSRLNGGLLDQVNHSFGQSLALKIRYAPENSPWKKLGKLMAARAMAQKPEFRDQVNIEEIDRQINQMCSQEPLKSEMESVRSIAAHSIKESVVPAQIAHLKSADFQRRLKLLSPEEGKQLIDLELHQLAALAPDQVQAVADELAGRSIQEQAARSFRDTEPALQKKAVEVAMGQVPGYQSHLAECAEPLAAVAAKIPPGLTPEQTDQAMIAELTALAVTAQAAQKLDLYSKIMAAKDFYGKLAAGGRGPAFLNAIKLGAMVMKGVPDDPRQWSEAAGTVLRAGGQAHEVAQLFRVSQTGKAMNALKFIRWAGPLAETIGVVLSVRDMAADFQQGDYVGASCKGLQAVAGGAGVLAGIYIAAGCTGPFWPAVAIGGTIAYWTLAGLDQAFGDSDEVSFLKGLGVYRG